MKNSLMSILGLAALLLDGGAGGSGGRPAGYAGSGGQLADRAEFDRA